MVTDKGQAARTQSCFGESVAGVDARGRLRQGSTPGLRTRQAGLAGAGRPPGHTRSVMCVL